MRIIYRYDTVWETKPPYDVLVELSSINYVTKWVTIKEDHGPWECSWCRDRINLNLWPGATWDKIMETEGSIE